MTAATSRSLSPMLLPVLDILTIVTIAFLATSGAFSLLSAADQGRVTAKQEIKQSQEDIEKLQRYLAVLKAEHTRLQHEAARSFRGSALQQSHAKLVAEIKEIENRLEKAKTRFSRLRELTEILSKQVRSLIAKVREYGRVTLFRDKEASGTQALVVKEVELKARLGKLKRQLADLEAKKARENEKASAPKLGVSVATQRSVERQVYVVLHEGRVYPDIGKFFSKQTSPSGTITATPDEDGLTVADAIADGSLLLKEVSTPGFERIGRIMFLVNSDSFAAYRVLRDKLVNLGVDYGWEPWQHGVKIISSRGGRGGTRSQGRR